MADDSQKPPQKLDYHSRLDEPKFSMAHQVVLGALLVSVVGIGGVFALVLLGIAVGDSGGPVLAIGIGIFVLLLLIHRGIAMNRHPATRGWALGIWIGLGITALVEGACFSTAMG